MLLIKNDPKYHEQWPRALVPYKRIYGVDEPRRLTPLANDGKLSPHLPEGTPFGLVGTSSLYKRESYPYGVVRPGSVTATFAGEKDPTGYRGLRHLASTGPCRAPTPASTPTTTSTPSASCCWSRPPRPGPKGGRTFYNHAHERHAHPRRDPGAQVRRDGKQPLDPDGNPDTSFLAKIPADVAWTFQTLDKNGMVLNMAQTWHQVRPGEIRNDCGGCHAHSQKPTHFEETAAAKPDYAVFDLTKQTPLLTTQEARRVRQEVGREGRDRPALREGRQERRVFPRRQADPRAQLRRLPHAEGGQAGRQPGAGRRRAWSRPRTRPASASTSPCPAPTPAWPPTPPGKYGHKPLHRHGWTDLAASRYVRLIIRTYCLSEK